MIIYLTRHSQTIWNEEKRLQGRLDSPLTANGIKNAEALKEYIHNYSIDYIYSSPTLRAYHTAEIVFPDHNIIKDKRLLEMDFGTLEGRKISDILKTDYELYHQLWNEPELFQGIPQGESYEDVIKRLQSFIHDLKKLPDQSTVMIVTHGMCFIVLFSLFMGYEKKDYVKINQKVVDGCSLTCIHYKNDQFELQYYNECSYLPFRSNETFAK